MPDDPDLRQPHGVVPGLSEGRTDRLEMVVSHPQYGVFQLQVDTAAYPAAERQCSTQAQRQPVRNGRTVRISFVIGLRVNIGLEELPVHGRGYPYCKAVFGCLPAEYPEIGRAHV